MKSLAILKNLATNLSNNTSAANDALMIQLVNDQHRYLIQKYFVYKIVLISYPQSAIAIKKGIC